MSGTLSSVRGAVYEGMDKTRAAVSVSVSTVLESRVARMVSSGVDSALSTSESLVEQYLPLTEDELGEGTNNYTLNTGIPFFFNNVSPLSGCSDLCLQYRVSLHTYCVK